MANRILVIGNGAREHALAFKLSRESNNGDKTREIFVLGGNALLAREFECLKPKDDSVFGLTKAAESIAPKLVVVGPEVLLAQGLADELRSKNIPVFGPTKHAAMLESSKAFCKEILNQSGVKTASYARFSDFEVAAAYVSSHHRSAMVIKVDGLCAGKGVTVCNSKTEAILALEHLFNRDGFSKLQAPERVIIIEDFLSGGEVSVFGAAYENDVALFCPMQDHKRLLDFDQGPNTGGMGAVGPLGTSIEARRAFLSAIKEAIFLPVLQTMSRSGHPFSGLLYAGLMLTEQGPFLLEFNVRFGDPETQALLFGTTVDMYPLLSGIANHEKLDMDWWQSALMDMEPTVSIVLAGRGYPTEHSDPTPLILPSSFPDHTKLFFAATDVDDRARPLAKSGRVMSVVARGATVEAARSLGYGLLREIEFSGMQYRKDIGTKMTELTF